MNILMVLGGILLILFLFGWCFLAVGILGRGWFIYPNRNPKDSPRP